MDGALGAPGVGVAELGSVRICTGRLVPSRLVSVRMAASFIAFAFAGRFVDIVIWLLVFGDKVGGVMVTGVIG